jgi:peptidoglycan/xylan/chitin deacetylase (PgdA/CDA1 family)
MQDARDRKIRLVMDAARLTGAARLLSPLLSGAGAILMLHRVTASPPGTLGLNDGLSVSPDFLDATLREVRRLGYALVSMDEAAESLATGRGNRRFAAVTLDDGYLDNLENALPVFEANDAPFTIFIAPGLADGRVALWWEEVDRIVSTRSEIRYEHDGEKALLAAATPDEKRHAAATLFSHVSRNVAEHGQQAFLHDLDTDVAPPSGPQRLMDWGEIARIAAHPLGTIGAHTVHHYALKRLATADATAEIADSRRLIEDRIGHRPRHFAYPYGHADAVGTREVGLARDAGFLTAVTTRHGVLRAAHRDHMHALPRISINGRFQDVAYVRTMLSGFTTLANSRRLVVTV